MKIFLSIFLELLNLSFSLIPIWDLKNSSVNLLPLNNYSNEILIYNYSNDKLSVILTKKLARNNSEVKDTNYITITINNEIQMVIKTDFEDIDSSYFIEKAGYFICPKGKHFIYEFDENKGLIEIVPQDFNQDKDNDNWVLKCFILSKDIGSISLLISFLFIISSIFFNYF